MGQIVELPVAVSELVGDGDSVALEGFSHLVPFAAGHELIRQGQTDLTLIRMVPDLIADQLIGTGRLKCLAFSWAGNPGVGSLHRFRDAVENEWPRPLELEEHSHAGMANRYVAGASGLPFAVMRGYVGTDLAARAEAAAPSSSSSARSPASASPPSPPSAPTSRSSTPSAPTAPATCSYGGSSACRRRRCSPRADRWSRSRRSSRSSSRCPAR